MNPIRLSIFGRLTIGFLAIILVMASVSMFALYQIRQIIDQSTSLVAHHYPAIDTAKWLLANIYAQERSDREYLAVGDPVFLEKFNEEADEFRRTVASLKDQDGSQDSRQFLITAEAVQEKYTVLFHRYAVLKASTPRQKLSEYESRRKALISEIASALQSSLEIHEALVAEALKDSLQRSQQAERLTTTLGLGAVILGIGFAAVATYTILAPLRRLQEHIRKIGQGEFRNAINVPVPSDLCDLVESVRSMATKLQDLDDMKAEFLSHMTHELRSPMTAIHAGTQLLLEQIPGPISENQRTTLQIMEESSREVINMISGLLDLAKFESGMMEYHPTSVDLMSNVHAAIQKVQLLAERERIRIIVNAPSDPVRVYVDENRIQQVLDNLLSNALKFSPEGALVCLKLEPDIQKKMLQISVSDTGRGIAPESLPHIFENFYGGSTSTSTKVPGSGIGLALAKKVVEGHGGRIWAESELGKGTTMRFILPLASSC
jgi:two-component system sensor histidine kinase GlrK